MSTPDPDSTHIRIEIDTTHTDQPCQHAREIANQIALHDFPGLPHITELAADVAAPYLDLAVKTLTLD